MSRPAFIAGDWGTSNLRLALCDAEGVAIEIRKGAGAAESRGKFAEVFDALSADWRAAHGALPAVLCGMVGSAFGWVEAPYLSCPEDLDGLADGLIAARPDVHIVPGMRCTNPLGAPDVMRGEETQLLGARQVWSTLAGRQLVCMPGTHTKWVSLLDGIVQEFLTVPTGELFALLCEHSVLVRDKTTPIVHLAADYERGLAESARHPEIPVLHRLFQGRSLRLDKQLTPEGAASWMSGLLVGTDVAGAMRLFAVDKTRAVHVLGTPQLIDAYTTALARAGFPAAGIDGEQAALAGLGCVYRARQVAV